MTASKYIIVYNGIPFSCNSIEEAANTLFGFKVQKSANGRDWDIIVNGEEKAHYISSDEDKRNGYTKDEAVSDYMRNFVKKNTYSNLHWYKLIEG